MDERTKVKADALQWYVDFANLDLEHITRGDKAKLLIEAEERLGAEEEKREISKIWPAYLLNKERLGALAWAYDPIDRESQQYWECILAGQKSVRDLFDHYLMWSVHPTSATPQKGDSKPGKYLSGNAEFRWILTSGFEVPYRLVLFPITSNRNDYVIFRIIRLLEGFPSHAVKRCLSCRKYLFNPRGKRKQYCSDKCMWRVSTRKWRKANPEKYRQNQRELMADLREEKIGRKRKKTIARRAKQS